MSSADARAGQHRYCEFRNERQVECNAVSFVHARMFQNIGEMVLLLVRTLQSLPLLTRQRRKVFDQLFEIGNASLLMACILSMFIGGVISLQTGPLLAKYGLATSIGGGVGTAMAKELAPVMMAILIAGRIGSAMAAEIGSMRVYQEIDALRTMNIDPIHYLVLPRIVAISIALPMLVIFSILVGWFGGAMVAAGNEKVGISFQTFFSNLRQVVEFSDRFVCAGFADDWWAARHRAFGDQGGGELDRVNPDLRLLSHEVFALF